MAVAEKAIEFEHRDLHWGNILISPTNDNYIHYKIGQKNIELISNGVKVYIENYIHFLLVIKLFFTNYLKPLVFRCLL